MFSQTSGQTLVACPACSSVCLSVLLFFSSACLLAGWLAGQHYSLVLSAYLKLVWGAPRESLRRQGAN